MSGSAQQFRPPIGAGEARRSNYGGWTLYEHSCVTSTNLVAATLPAWSAVRADTQTHGRGRFQRQWISDEGGLWLSAVVPVPVETVAWSVLPLAAGLAVCGVLAELKVGGFRLRWPNDVLVDDRKLAGLLIDQFTSGLAVVGIGMNVTNRPENADRKLANLTIRLADLLDTTPQLPDLTEIVLRNLFRAVSDLEHEGASALLKRVNGFWMGPRKVELDLDGVMRRGTFHGVDAQGRLTLADSSGLLTFYDAHQVRHLTET